MTLNQVAKEYFEWLCDFVDVSNGSRDISFSKLLNHLHNTEFTYTIPKDENRASDGLYLRYRFTLANRYEPEVADLITGPCSVLEMMVSLALACEENIMDDPKYGNRTAQWFWKMIASLGLSDMYNALYDESHVTFILQRFLDREYLPNGKGGLFTIKNCPRDLRDVEIWYQCCWYLDKIIGY